MSKPKTLRQRMIDRAPPPRRRMLSAAIRGALADKPQWSGLMIGNPPNVAPVIRIIPAKPEHAEET